MKFDVYSFYKLILGVFIDMSENYGKLYMVLEVDAASQTMTLYDPVYDDTIKHLAKDQDEIEVYGSVFDNCTEINLFMSVEYNVQTREIMRA